MKVFGGVCCFGLFQEKIGTDCDVLEQSSGPSSSPDGNMHVYSEKKV